MSGKLIIALNALLVLSSCIPDNPCAGQLVFDDVSELCYECPAGAKYKNHTCECPEGSTFKDLKCVKTDDGSSSTADSGTGADAGPNASPDAGTYQSNGCKSYCEFETTCIGGNSLAVSALSDIVKGLHADNAATCENSCKNNLGSKEATDPAIACFVAGKDTTMCKDPNAQTGLTNAFGLIGQCCAPNASSELCKSICATLKASPLVASMVPFCG